MTAECLPDPNDLRIIYSVSDVNVDDPEDPVMKNVANLSKEVRGWSRFRQSDGKVGVAFFCVLKEGWQKTLQTAPQAQSGDADPCAVAECEIIEPEPKESLN